MPWRFEERTSLAVPRRGLSWRHLKASTQSTNKIRGQPGAPQPPHDKHCAPRAPHTHPGGRRQPQCPCLSQGRGDGEKSTPTPGIRSPKKSSWEPGIHQVSDPSPASLCVPGEPLCEVS